jgi:class 3 adenylate cyclase
MTKLPAGTVTFVFTDIEGSTRFLHTLGGRYRDAVEQHRTILRDAFTFHGGVEVDTQGVFFIALHHTPARAAGRGHSATRPRRPPWPQGAELRVRVGIHTGTRRSQRAYWFAPGHLSWGGLTSSSLAHFCHP